jgi:hypothetical protein
MAGGSMPGAILTLEWPDRFDDCDWSRRWSGEAAWTPSMWIAASRPSSPSSTTEKTVRKKMGGMGVGGGCKYMYLSDVHRLVKGSGPF